MHVWGYYDLEHYNCKDPLGWGTVFVIGIYKELSIWLTVEHNVETKKYFGYQQVATNWFIKDTQGNWRELIKIGCYQDRYCLLISTWAGSLPLLGLDNQDQITNEVRVFEDFYSYGCTVLAERVIRYAHYKLHFLCFGDEGRVISEYSINSILGGDVLVSNRAMPGFSGSPGMVIKNGQIYLVGIVNSGIEGIFTAIRFVKPGLVDSVIQWLKSSEKLDETHKP